MRRRTCPVHPGIITETRPCYRCHVDTITQPIRNEVATMRTELANLEEAPMETATVDGVDAASITAAIERAAESTWKQPSLNDAIFKPMRRQSKPVVKLALSGSMSLNVQALGDLTADEDGVVPVLAEGMLMDVTGTAYVKAISQEVDAKGEPVLSFKLALVGLSGVRWTGEIWEAGE